MTLYGPCAAGSLCRAYDKQAQQAEDTDGHSLGPACLRVAEFAVKALPADWVGLEQLLPRPLGQWGDGQPKGSDGPPIPLNLSVEALQRSIWWAVTTWEEILRDQDRLSDVPNRRPGPAVRRFVGSAAGVVVAVKIDGRVEHESSRSRPMRAGPVDVARAVTILAPRMARLSDLPAVELAAYPLADEDESQRFMGITHTKRFGWQGVMDLVQLHSRASSALGLTSPVRRLPGLCSACGRDELRQDQPRFGGDEQLVYCGNCAAGQTYDEWRRAMGAWAA